jgi:hypothetical protein
VTGSYFTRPAYRLSARAFDHHGAGVPEPIGLLEELDAFRAQLRDPGIKIGNTEHDHRRLNPRRCRHD